MERGTPSRTLRSPADLKRLTRSAADELHNATAAEIIRWAATEFGHRFAIASSMQDAVLAHIAATTAPGVTVIFLDTGYHFPETLGTRDAVAATLPVTLANVTPLLTVEEQDRRFGPDLYAVDPDLCCQLRKVDPLDEALAELDAWATGARSIETSHRRDTPVVSWDSKRNMVRLAPLARWTDEDVDRYIDKHGILVNPLRQAGYRSIGCGPCTRPTKAGEDPRSGRWAGFDKTECGINL